MRKITAFEYFEIKGTTDNIMIDLVCAIYDAAQAANAESFMQKIEAKYPWIFKDKTRLTRQPKKVNKKAALSQEPLSGK